jgi:predicted nucleic acid-binding protein
LIFDTDVLIWYIKGNERAHTKVEESAPFSISVVTYMELVQGMRNKAELKTLLKFLKKKSISILHIDQDISSRAMFFVEDYFLSNSLQVADALIAATCIQAKEVLVTGNDKHYKYIPNIQIEIFRPEE